MRIEEGSPTLSATDLANHLGCRHLTVLDAAAARGELRPPRWRDPALEVMRQRGAEHEAAYVARLRHAGLEVAGAGETDGITGFDDTVAAMRSGVDVIVQAPLQLDRWRGRADILLRVATASALGDWSYQVVDTKLARKTRAGTILQLCLYSAMVAVVQELVPERMYVVTPGDGFPTERYRLRDYFSYFRLIRARLVQAVGDGSAATYPEPVAQCDICRWWPVCDRRRRGDDHLSLVAGISQLQRREIVSWGVATLADLARVPLPRRPRRGHAESYVRVREQARVQRAGRLLQAPVHELLPRAPGQGLGRLPAPSPGDIFFDIEGAPFVGSGGLEYLLGWVILDRGEPRYHLRWADNGVQERAAFEAFVDAVMERWARYPDLHVYHFAPYEPGAVKRLMGRYASREEQVDRMLRAELFVDLYAVTRQSLRASVERYSIKDLEQFYGYARDVKLRAASQNLHTLEHALELRQLADLPDGVREVVQQYNRDDCVSMMHLRDWLEHHRDSVLAAGEDLPRPAPAVGDPSEQVDERQRRVHALMARLLDGVPEDEQKRSPAQQACWLLAHLLDWHRREDKAGWWEFFRLGDLDEEALLYEDLALSGLQFVEDTGEGKRAPIHRYRFPPQETRIGSGDALFIRECKAFGSVAAIDVRRGSVTLKKRIDSAALHPAAVFTRQVVPAPEQAEALFRLGEWVAEHGVDSTGHHRAARDLLLRRSPRLRGVAYHGPFVAPQSGSRNATQPGPHDAAPLDPHGAASSRLHGTLQYGQTAAGPSATPECALSAGPTHRSRGVPPDPDRDVPAILPGAGPPTADLSAPHGARHGGASLVRGGETTLAAARRLARDLDGGVLALQGPPGAGKTYTGARMICELVHAGKKVGITAISHKVIRNLLDEVVRAAGEEGIEVRCVRKVSGKPAADPGRPILEVPANPAVAAALADGSAQVAAGTAWLWAREEFAAAVDVLFIDEAGQMSLANVLAVAQAAANIVLLGDPQQLEQPSRGSHPEGAAVSALEHLLAGKHTIPSGRGLFLAETWRLHPAICSFTSELFYDGRLRSRPGLAVQAIDGATAFAGAGLWFCPVCHDGNQNSSPEEAERVAEAYTALLDGNVTWTRRDGSRVPLAAEDILIVAPYNAHVRAIADRLPEEARVGTVDRFQGQEAPVVIVSLATSSPEEAPRGMEFLYSLNRLNVATSRARCACILIANPLLFEPECRTPRQMRLANAFCRYLELATVC